MATRSKPQIHYINPERDAHYDYLVFHLFPRLVPELRLKIWRLAMARQCIVNIALQRGQEEIISDSASGAGSSKWRSMGDPGSPDAAAPCGIFVEGYQLMSKFLRVSRESRHEALSFHLVHIPCRLMSKPMEIGLSSNFIEPEDTTLGTLYIHPEYDFLHISTWFPPQCMTGQRNCAFFFDFIHRLKTVYDPHHVGLLNLAMNSNDIDQLASDNLSVPSRQFVESLNQLHEFFVLFPQGVGRINLGFTTGTSDNDFHFTRSFPIMPLTPVFTRLEQDPRPITEDLKKLNLGDYRNHFSKWLLLLRKWGATYSNQTCSKFLITHTAHKLHDCVNAEIWLDREDEYWKAPDHGKNLKLYEKEDMEAAVKPALGFWLFPIDAFGPYTQFGDPVNWEDQRALRNLSSHSPELALSSLPQVCPKIPGYCPHFKPTHLRRFEIFRCKICGE